MKFVKLPTKTGKANIRRKKASPCRAYWPKRVNPPLMLLGAVNIIVLLWVGAPAASASDSSTPISVSTPAAALEPMVVSVDRQKTLVEMWTRRILGPESDTWTAGDLTLLGRMHQAEAVGALDLL